MNFSVKSKKIRKTHKNISKQNTELNDDPIETILVGKVECVQVDYK